MLLLVALYRYATTIQSKTRINNKNRRCSFIIRTITSNSLNGGDDTMDNGGDNNYQPAVAAAADNDNGHCNIEIIPSSSLSAIVFNSKQPLKKILEDETYHDLTITTSDGLTITANRAVLAAASPVFHASFFGSFKESCKEETVEVEYSAVTIRNLISYAHKVPIGILDGGSKEPVSRENCDGKFNYLVELADAATYYQISDLRDQIEEQLKNIMNADLAVMYLAWTGNSQENSKWIGDLALKCIRRDPSKLLDLHDMTKIPYSVMESIVKDKHLVADEFTIFRIVMKWSACDGIAIEEGGQRFSPEELCTRKQEGSALTEHIDLNKIHPTNLASSVEASGLVTPEHLAQAFRSHAIDLSRETEAKFKRRRIDYCGPRSCIVSGAGTPEINGEYTRDGEFRGGFKFSKITDYNGTKSKFSIMRSLTRGQRYRWYISIPDTEQPGTFRDIDFYRAHEEEKNSPIPPVADWKIWSYRGLDPPPTIELRYEETKS